MLEYPGFCYLDVEKTGSTFIRKFLYRNAIGAPVEEVKHRRVKRWRRGGVFHFTSARDPLDQYRSLYVFGCEGKGALMAHQIAEGTELAATYDGDRQGFHAWLELLLSDQRREFFTPPMRALYTPALGFMSTRFLRLNLMQGMTLLPLARTPGAVEALWALRALPRAVVHQERLRADMADLVRGPLAPFMRDVGTALADLADSDRENVTSDAARDLASDLPDALARRLRDLEWFHYRHLGYST